MTTPEPGIALALAIDRARRVADLRYDLQLTLPSNPIAPVTGAVTITFSLSDASSPLVLDFAPGASGLVAHLAVNGTAVDANLRAFRLGRWRA